MTPEFSRTERLDSIGGEPREVTIVADEQERAALARRFGLVSVERLEARFTVRRDGAGVVASGQVTAAVTQACSVTGEPLDAAVDEAVALRFVSPGSHAEDEVELAGEALDTIEIEGSAIDLGEAAAETMSLALDPFPRAPGAEEALKAAGILSEEEAGSFGALAGLRGKLAERGDPEK